MDRSHECGSGSSESGGVSMINKIHTHLNDKSKCKNPAKMKMNTSGERKIHNMASPQQYKQIPPGFPPNPKYTAKISFDGTDEDGHESYAEYLQLFRNICYNHGIKIDTSISGTKEKVCTTLEKGTFHVLVQLGEACVTFIIDLRHGWLRGYCIGDQVYELKPDKDEKIYMPHANRKELPFEGNHRKISGGAPGKIRIGANVLRKKLKELVSSNGRIDPEIIGLFTLYLCEGPKVQTAGDALLKSLIDPGMSRLEIALPSICQLLTNWSGLSGVAMNYMQEVSQGKVPSELEEKKRIPGVIDSVQDILKIMKILHIDGINKGIFSHRNVEDPNNWLTSDDIWKPTPQKRSWKGKATSPEKKGNNLQLQTPKKNPFRI